MSSFVSSLWLCPCPLSGQQVGEMTRHVFLVIRVVKWPTSSVLEAITTKLNSQVENCPPTGLQSPVQQWRLGGRAAQASLSATACDSEITGSTLAFSVTIFQRFIHKAIFHFSLVFSPFHIYLLTVSVLALTFPPSSSKTLAHFISQFPHLLCLFVLQK